MDNTKAISHTLVNGDFKKKRVICFCAVLLTCLCTGFGYAWSVMQTPIVKAFGWNAASVSLTFTMTVVFSTLSPLFLGKIIGKMSTQKTIFIGAIVYGFGLFATGFITELWQLYLFYGVFSGLGCGMVYPTMMSYSVRLFPDKPGFASGLATAAYGAGAIIWAPVAVALTDAFTISYAFHVLGLGFALIILCMSFLMKEPPKDFMKGVIKNKEKKEVKIETTKDLRRIEMVKTTKFYLTLTIFTFGLTAGLMIISQASPILQQSLLFTPAKAAIFVSVFAACNMAGRFFWGGISDKIGVSKVVTYILIVAIVSMVTLSFVSLQPIILIAMGIAASCYGGLASVLTPLTSAMFGRRYLTENYGVMYVVFGLASLVAPNVAIAFKNMSGTYIGAYVTAAILAILALLLSTLLKQKDKTL